MSLATDVLEGLQKLSKATQMKTKEDDSSMDTNNSPDTEENGEADIDMQANLEKLEAMITESFADLGLTSVEVVQEDDGDVYADLVFEDMKQLSLQFFVENGEAKLAILDGENYDNPPEVILPETLVDEDGSLNTASFGDIDMNVVKTEVKAIVEPSNTTEVFRRSRSTNESFEMKRTKKRVSIKLKNENKSLKAQIKKLKK